MNTMESFSGRFLLLKNSMHGMCVCVCVCVHKHASICLVYFDKFPNILLATMQLKIILVPWY